MSKFTPKIARPFSTDTREELRELSDKSEWYRDKLDAQWQSLKKEAGHVGGKALVIGGVTLGVYLLMNALLPDERNDGDEEKEDLPAPEKVKSSSVVGSAVKSLLWTAALGFAKEKISDYISSEFVNSREREGQSSEDIIGQSRPE